ncbi:hypothetical protein [Saccharothrix sp. ALI-22-I]|nr:hypothetical protein [Saccharothrix sp. ALI-22-I]
MDDALPLLAKYGQDTRALVQRELAAAWSSCTCSAGAMCRNWLA